MTADSAGNVYVADSGNDRVTKGTPSGSTPPRGQQPRIIVDDSQFGFSTGAFGFNVCSAPSQAVAVERSSDLVNWLPLQTNSLSSGLFYFSDPGAKVRPQQIYRARLAQ